MSVVYRPKEMLEEAMPERVVKRLVDNELTLNRAAVVTLSRTGVLNKKKIEKVALRVIKGYRARFAEERASGESVAAATAATLNDKRNLVAKVQNEAVFEIAKEIKEYYRGDRYRWLPSSAETPDPEHQLLYGTVRRIGVGEMPGDRYGCQCGMEIITDEEELFQEDLDDDE